jgi:hypothetical protein
MEARLVKRKVMERKVMERKVLERKVLERNVKCTAERAGDDRRGPFVLQSSLAAVAVGLALGLCGCSGIDHATLDGVTTMPDDSTLASRGGQMNSGIATAFQPRVWTHNIWGTHEQSDGIDVQTSNADVVRVAHVSDNKRVVVWAVGPGTATVSITLDGDTAMAIPVTVTDPQ